MNPTVIQNERQDVVVDTCVKQTDLFGGTLDFLAEPVFKKLAFLITDLVTLMVTFVPAKNRNLWPFFDCLGEPLIPPVTACLPHFSSLLRFIFGTVMAQPNCGVQKRNWSSR